jgi:hypothetical protein
MLKEQNSKSVTMGCIGINHVPKFSHVVWNILERERDGKL